MRASTLPRLVPLAQRIISSIDRLRSIVSGPCVGCVRAVPRRGIKTERQRDIKADENFLKHATSTPVSTLLASPRRDSHLYDEKPPVQFSTPAISALHARIGLPSAFPLSTLRRCLTDPSLETDHSLHNEALSVIGSGLLEYYVAEHLCVRWPRLPMKTQLAALWAYTGESALARIAREWGIKSQVLQARKGNSPVMEGREGVADPKLVVQAPRSAEEKAAAAQFDESFEYEIKEQARLGWLEPRARPVTGGFMNKMEDQDYEKRFVLFAMQRFVQSLVGGVLVHSGMQVTQNFIKAHILSRSLPPLSTLHIPTNPVQELTTLCERLKIPLPISRLIAESGRQTRTPIFVVGVYSGREKLGEGQGRSLKEAKTRACVNGIRAWYLYEQAGWEFALPSRTEDPEKKYVMGYVDPGSIVI